MIPNHLLIFLLFFISLPVSMFTKEKSLALSASGRRTERGSDTSRVAVILFLVGMTSFVVIHIYGGDNCSSKDGQVSRKSFYNGHLQKVNALKQSVMNQVPRSRVSPGILESAPVQAGRGARVYHVTSYGADPTGRMDSTNAILEAITDALKAPGYGFLMDDIVNLGGARVDLDGGNYLISRPLKFPITRRGNLVIHGGSIRASDDFPDDGYLIDLSPFGHNNTEYIFEFVTFRDLLLDSNFRGGGIQVVNSLRTSIDNCYLTHFNTTGISVKDGHETYIRFTYLGQRITAGGHPDERNFAGTAISLAGNDNAVTDVVIFSAAVGIILSGQANTISGVHCYNKATELGGVGIYLKTPGLTQTRIVHSYLDFTGIVAEDPVQVTVASCFFLGDAYVTLKSVKGVVNGVNIVDNMFAGSNRGVEIVQLDQRNGNFTKVDQIVIDRNNVNGMKLKATVARGRLQRHGSSWEMDFNSVLVFPNLIRSVQYAFTAHGNSFPVHGLRNSSGNKVVIQSNVPVQATVQVTVDQGGDSLSFG